MIIPEKIKRKVELLIKDVKEDECLEWEGSLSKSGYPDINTHIEGKKYHGLLHRIAYQLYYDEDITSNDFICHKCDNPRCYNPLHLFKGTHQDNMDDMKSKGRSCKGNKNARYIDGRASDNKVRKIRKYGVLSNEQVLEVRRLKSEGIKLTIIAERLNIPYQTVRDISCGKSYINI